MNDSGTSSEKGKEKATSSAKTKTKDFTRLSQQKVENNSVNYIDKLTKQTTPEHQKMTEDHVRQYREYLRKLPEKK